MAKAYHGRGRVVEFLGFCKGFGAFWEGTEETDATEETKDEELFGSVGFFGFFSLSTVSIRLSPLFALL